MRLHRFFIEEHLRNKKEVTLYDEGVIHQWKDVFRLHAGSQVILLDNSGFEYLAEITLLAKGKAEIKIIQANAGNMSDREVWLFASLVKKDNFEWILEKCTELGVSHFVPILSDRSEKKDLNLERAEKIIKEASEQSGRGVMPKLHEIMTLEQAVAFAEQHDIYPVAFHTETVATKRLDTKELENLKARNTLGAFIGPEGGWSEREGEVFTSEKIVVYNLGNQILRTETAAIAVASLLLI